MRGRKPKPTALKILEGVHPCRINSDEPTFQAARHLSPPAWLDRVAVEHWNEVAPVLRGAGLLTEADTHSLALMCEAFSYFRRFPDDHKARQIYLRICTEFGMTPSSRSRIKAPSEPKKDALAEFLARKRV